MSKALILTGVIILGTVGILTGAWYFIFSGNNSSTQNSTTFTPSFTSGTSVVPTSSNEEINSIQNLISTPANPNIFKVDDSPIAGATVIQTLRPTTTVVRYVKQENGHVFDLPLGIAGAVPKTISNSTIPGIVRALWTQKGNGVILQYLDNVIKTVHTSLATTTSQGSRIRFLPDGIIDLAVSPNGDRLVYVLAVVGGVDGYTASFDGSNSSKLFSLPLREILVSWPSQGTILAQSNSAAEVQGIAFSINSTSGNITTLVTGPGLTAMSDRTFTTVVYQTNTIEQGGHITFMRDMRTGANKYVGFDPFPERCMWSNTASSTLFCPIPYSSISTNYLDAYHAGNVSAQQSIFALNVFNESGRVLALPGSSDGGLPSEILEMAVSPDDKYLVFIRKEDRSLWGVRLAQ